MRTLLTSFKFQFYLILVLFIISLNGLSAASVYPGQRVTFQNSLYSMPLGITENQGQWDENVLFRSNAGMATDLISTDSVYYPFTQRISSEEVYSVGFHHRIMHRGPCH